MRVERPYFQDATARWDGDIYAHRFGFAAVEAPRRPLTAADFGTEILEALRVSGNSRGLPVEASVPEALIIKGLAGPGVAKSLGNEGELDRAVQAIARVEQQALRAGLLAGRGVAQCALCGNSFHAEHLVAAHIKRRSVCSPAERVDLSNVMLCCRFGCDNLFEHGYIASSLPSSCETASAVGLPSLRARTDVLLCRSSPQERCKSPRTPPGVCRREP